MDGKGLQVGKLLMIGEVLVGWWREISRFGWWWVGKGLCAC